MGANSTIEWTDASWSPIRARNIKTGKIGWHCEHVTSGCEFCYAEGINKWLGTGLPFKPGHTKDIHIFLDDKMLLAPLRWKRPRMIFVCSMTDAFADFVKDDWLDQMFAVMALCPQHTFQVLTKRPERMAQYFNGPYPNGDGVYARIAEATFRFAPHRPPKIPALPAYLQTRPIGPSIGGDDNHPEFGFRRFLWPTPLPNVWLGTSCEDQETFDTRYEHLRNTPGQVRFISFEPLLEAIDLRANLEWLHWAIVGGESGPNARPMQPQWARDIHEQCKDARIPFFFKQHGEWLLGEDGGDGRYLFQDGSDFWNISDGADIVIRAAQDAKEPTKIWRDLWGDGRGKLAKRVGKKVACRLLDSIEYNEFPGVS